jgi:hypothetical protein
MVVKGSREWVVANYIGGSKRVGVMGKGEKL